MKNFDLIKEFSSLKYNFLQNPSKFATDFPLNLQSAVDFYIFYESINFLLPGS